MDKAKVYKFWYWVKLLLVATAAVFVIRAFILIPLPVNGNSMESTIKSNDFLIYERLTNIDRFDVIVFEHNDGSVYIKRVIGLPGDHIRYEDDILYVNGAAIEETFLLENLEQNASTISEGVPYTTNFDIEELLGYDVIPENSYFVLGDNRRLSKDSRSFGVVNEEYIYGKARLIYYPLQDIRWIN